jgi:hypothetical protein
MVERNYRDFDLSIERLGDAYAARVLNSPAGQASAKFHFPFSEPEIENYVRHLGLRRSGERNLSTTDPIEARRELTEAMSFGGRLWNSVFDQEVLACLRTSLERAHEEQAGLRIRLRLANAPDLADLPWEYLYDSTNNQFLALSTDTPIIRYLDRPGVIRSFPAKSPLRILVMISSPKDHPLDVEQEYCKLREALVEPIVNGLVFVDRLELATLNCLQERLRESKYNVFHFIGHGGFDPATEGGVLFLESEDGHACKVDSQFLGEILHDHRSLRLVFLNCCEGGRSGWRNPFAGTAQGLIQKGIPAVLAMQFKISDKAAITLAREFYSSLAAGYPIDYSLGEARKSILRNVDQLEWATPVLFMQPLDGKLFEIGQTSPVTRPLVHRSYFRLLRIGVLIFGAALLVAWSLAELRFRTEKNTDRPNRGSTPSAFTHQNTGKPQGTETTSGPSNPTKHPANNSGPVVGKVVRDKPSDGYVLNILSIDNVPPMVHPGDTFELSVSFAIRGPDAKESFRVKTYIGIKREGVDLVHTAPPSVETPEGNAVGKMSSKLTIPTDAPAGQYYLEVVLETENHNMHASKRKDIAVE